MQLSAGVAMNERNLANELPPLLPNEQYVNAFQALVRARKLDDKAIVLFKQNKCHFQIGVAGHEAVQVAAAHCLKPAYDWFYPYYRDLALCTTLGMTPREFFLSAMCKADDPNSGGRQMPMHFGHQALNIVTQSSPTGTQYLQAAGAAKAIKYRGGDQVVYVSSGEGTTSQGDYHEALNIAAREKLPLVFLVQDNGFAISVPVKEQIAGESVAKISSGYEGLEVFEVDGLDYAASYEVLQRAVQRARTGQGPSVVDAKVVRLQSHSISDNQAKYRAEEDLERDKRSDPLALFTEFLLEQDILTGGQIEDIHDEIKEEINEAAAWADQQADPLPHTFEDHIYVDVAPYASVVENDPVGGEELYIIDAINRALDEEMELSEDLMVFGQDVAHGKGGVFTATAGLTNKYGVKRCFNSPLAESTIVGTAIGMATLGLKPVCEIQFGDYIWTAMMQIRNELSTIHYRSNGHFNCPVVVRVPVGGYINGGLCHSQNIEATFSHFPGLRIVMPSNATDAKGLLKSAVRSSDPVLFLEHKGLYRQVYAKGPVGDKDSLIPIGKAKVLREGSDATIITWGAMVIKATRLANKLAAEGSDVEVIDLRTIAPLDEDTLIKSVKKTGRALIVHEDSIFMGFGAEVSATLSEKAFEHLDAPLMRIAGENTPIPHSAVLEHVVLPCDERIERGLRKLLEY